MFSRIAFYFHNSTDFFTGVFGVPFIDDIAEGCELVVALGTVYTVIHRNKVNIMFRKHDLGIHTDLQIITPETRHIFDDNTLDKACLNICNHLLKARAVKGRAGNTIINIEFEVGISVFKSILLQDFFLVYNTIAVTLQFIVTGQATIQSSKFFGTHSCIRELKRGSGV